MDKPQEASQNIPVADRRTLERQQFNIPTPADSITIDPRKAEAWVTSEPDPSLQAVRRELVQSIHTVHFTEFMQRLDTVASEAVRTMHASGQSYALLYDTKPHASKRWAAELVQGVLEQYPPAQSSYLAALESPLGLPTITDALDRGINNFVVFDDAIYSGEQMLNQIVYPIARLARSASFQARYPHREISVTLAAPYIANRFLNDPIVRQLQAHGFLRIASGYEEMRTLDTTLSEASLEAIQSHGGRISSDPAEDVFYAPPAYVFDHRVPDNHSFPVALHVVLSSRPSKPYDDPHTAYYRQEDASFQSYYAPIVEKH